MAVSASFEPSRISNAIPFSSAITVSVKHAVQAMAHSEMLPNYKKALRGSRGLLIL